jgi:hypothetical protein
MRELEEDEFTENDFEEDEYAIDTSEPLFIGGSDPEGGAIGAGGYAPASPGDGFARPPRATALVSASGPPPASDPMRPGAGPVKAEAGQPPRPAARPVSPASMPPASMSPVWIEQRDMPGPRPAASTASPAEPARAYIGHVHVAPSRQGIPDDAPRAGDKAFRLDGEAVARRPWPALLALLAVLAILAALLWWLLD